jgi:hypothetical protein
LIEFFSRRKGREKAAGARGLCGEGKTSAGLAAFFPFPFGGEFEKEFMREEITTRDLRHHFDPKERVRLAEDFAHELLTLKSAQAAFGIARKAHDEAVEKLQSRMADLSRKLCEGWEYRDIRCRVLFNDPQIGQKTFMRIDTGEVVGIEEMTHEEKQEPLPLTGD